MTRYRNFDLELFDYRREQGRESFRVRVAQAPDGSQMALAEASAVALPEGLRGTVQRLEHDRLDRAALITLGLTLGDLLLPAGAPRELFTRAASRLETRAGLRLRLHIEAPELAALPWELAYLDLPGTRASERDERGFLALRRQLSIVRHEVLPAPVASFESVSAPRWLGLFSGAVAGALSPLDLGRERAGIEAVLESSGIERLHLERASLPALQQALDGGAQLFHFAGHGQFPAEMGEIPRTSEGKGYLVLEDETGGPVEVPAEQVGLNLAGAGVRLAVLNGCETGRRDPVHAWSGIAPLLVQAGIPAVLAHQFKIGDDAAIELAARFYEKLAAGEPVDGAVAAARLALGNRAGASPRDFATPVLYLRLAEDSDGVLLPRAAPAAGRGEGTDEPPPNRWFWLNLLLLAALVAGVLPWLASRWWGVDLLLGAGSGVVTLFAAWGIVDRLAGEHLNRLLRAWLRRRVATVGLASALAAGGLAAALAPPPGNIVLLLPYDGVVSRLPGSSPGAGPGSCAMRITVGGRAPLLIDGLWRQAVFLAAREDAVAERVQGGALTRSLLALRPAGEREEGRRRFYDALLERRRVERIRVGEGERLRVEILERPASGNETVLFDAEVEVSELRGKDVRVWFLEGESP